jgi:Bacterial capsule synthesis protein PGA_cap
MIRRQSPTAVAAALTAAALLMGACDGSPTVRTAHPSSSAVPTLTPGRVTPSSPTTDPVDVPSGAVTLAFAGDMHFELHLAALLTQPHRALGRITPTLLEPDLTMVNLESAITQRGVPLHADYHFNTSPKALDLLVAAGIDVVTLANNHAVDYGPVGLVDTLRAVRTSPVPVVGIGANQAAAFRPYRVSVRGTDFAFFAASSVPDQLIRSAAGPDRAGIAAARNAKPRLLVDAVRRASRREDVVVVYLHWGREQQACPTSKQRITARALAEAGADIVVGSHAHVLLGSGWMGDTYVNYGLGNFLWYHNRQPESGVLRLLIRDGAVVGDTWLPARIQTYGRPRPLSGQQRAAAVASWARLRRCSGLAARPSS